MIIAGDFNCQSGTKLCDLFYELIDDNGLVLSDCKRLANVFTYCSDNGKNSSWIDHIVCSSAIDDCIQKVEPMYDYVTSDHVPLQIVFEGLCLTGHIPAKANLHKANYAFDWNKVDDNTICTYQNRLDNALATVLPHTHF